MCQTKHGRVGMQPAAGGQVGGPIPGRQVFDAASRRFDSRSASFCAAGSRPTGIRTPDILARGRLHYHSTEAFPD